MQSITRSVSTALCATVSFAFAQAPTPDVSKMVVILGTSPASVSANYNESVYVTNLNLSTPIDIFNLPPNEVGLSSAIASDGKTVVIATRDISTDQNHIRRISTSTGAVQSHTTLDPNASEISFTPDAKNATYMYPTGSQWDVYMAPVAGGASRRLTNVGDVSPFAPAVIADNRLYYCGPSGVIRSEDFLTHRAPRTFPAASYSFTVSPSGDTIFYHKLDGTTGVQTIESIDTWNGFHDVFVLDDQTMITPGNLAVSQNEHYLYFSNGHHGAHGSGTIVAERLNVDNGKFSYPATGIGRTYGFFTTGANPNK